MRFVVVGAGAIGGVVGGRLAQHGHEVLLVARGEHAAAIRRNGLLVESPDGAIALDVPVTTELTWDVRPEDVVLLAVKSQDTCAVLDVLVRVVSATTPIVCFQNGVDNEREALRRFENVYAVTVMCPTGYVTPGVVQAYSSPITGLFDIGRYPQGTDAITSQLVTALGRSTFDCLERADVMRWKYAKLLMNLGNAVEAVCGPPARGRIAGLARTEGVACLRAAGIDVASEAEDAERRGSLMDVRPIDGQARPGGSTWQSLHRVTGSTEVDYLNGEIVLLGRLHGVPTPVNELLQELASELARTGAAPGSVTVDDFFTRLDQRETP